MTEFQSNIELQQCPGKLIDRQIELGQNPGEAETMDQAEHERNRRPGKTKQGPDVVQRRQDDGRGDGGFNDGRGQADQVERGQRQRDRMGQREHGDDASERP